MKKLFLILITTWIILLTGYAGAQNLDKHFIRKQLNIATEEAARRIKSGEEFKTTQIPLQTNFNSGISQNIQLYKNFKMPPINKKAGNINIRGYDTLWISTDTTITGTWTHTGPIFIVLSGILRIKNANITNYGDIILWGSSPKLYVDNSTLYFPQDYFYQRSLMSIMNCYVYIKNSTLNYSGLSHNLYAANHSLIEMENVTNIGFTTNGLFGNTTIKINGSNQAGEYIVTDSAKLEFRHTHTILLWHHFPSSSLIDFSFPSKADTVWNYRFNNSLTGVKGISYEIKIDSCYDLMWGLMPSSGSDVTITQSKLRAIGLWFEKTDSFHISGLVDNSHYADFIASFNDRNLHLKNCDVMTWSLYPMKHSILDLTGSIVGEIGLQGKSKVTGMNFTVDGSGGYFWATDTTVAFVGFYTSYNDVRSDQNAIFIIAYSSVINGAITALKNSVMLCIQNNSSEDPIPYDNGVVWNAKIDKPSKTYANRMVPIFGSVWIDHAGKKPLMKWGHYEMYYQRNTETNWHKILVDSNKEIRNDTLAIWNTNGLAPDLYTIKLVISDSSGFKAEAVKGINLMPAIIEGNSGANYEIKTMVWLEGKTIKLKIRLPEPAFLNISLMDITGKVLKKIPLKQFISESQIIDVNCSDFASGIYFIRLSDKKNNFSKVMKIKL